MGRDEIRLPDYHFHSPETAAIQAALKTRTDWLEVLRDELFEQLHVTGATWGLILWERLTGVGTNLQEPLDIRRSRVMSRLRGRGVTTKEMIANVAAAFTGGEIEVIEFPGDYYFDVKFSGLYGTPSNMEALSAAIDEIRPAHLLYGYLYSYLLIRDVHGVMTLHELEQTVLNKFAGGGR